MKIRENFFAGCHITKHPAGGDLWVGNVGQKATKL